MKRRLSASVQSTRSSATAMSVESRVSLRGQRQKKGKLPRMTRRRREAGRRIWRWWLQWRWRIRLARERDQRAARRIQAAWWRHRGVRRIALRERAVRMRWYVLFAALRALRGWLGHGRLQACIARVVHGAEHYADLQRTRHRALQGECDREERGMLAAEEALARTRVARGERAAYLALCDDHRALRPKCALPPIRALVPAAPRRVVPVDGGRGAGMGGAVVVKSSASIHPVPPAARQGMVPAPPVRPLASARRLRYWGAFLANMPCWLLASEAAVEALLLREVASRELIEKEQLRAAPYLEMKRKLRPVPTILSVNDTLYRIPRRIPTPLEGL